MSTTANNNNTMNRPRAVLIGINYKGTSSALQGCANDQVNVYNWLYRDHPDMETRILCDESSIRGQMPVDGMPTRANMMDALRWLVRGATAQSRLFFSYSGHGSNRATGNVNETDGRDELLCPMDFDRAGGILDDELRATIVDPLPAGARLSVVLDCCFSGTALDLRYNWQDQSVYVGRPVGGNARALAPKAKNSSFLIPNHRRRDETDGHTERRPAVAAPAEYDPQMYHRCLSYAFEERSPASAADVVMISGCRDTQTSADAYEGGKYTGALTYAFLKFNDARSPSARADPLARTLGNLLQDLNQWLTVHKYDQRPQLSTGRVTDIDAPWSWL